jgi:predicted nucleic acid-binding protein
MAGVYVDSNIFFYARIMDKVYGKSCADAIRRIQSRKIEASASTLVPIEVANAMRKYGLAKEAANEIHAIFALGMEILPVEGTDVQESVGIYRDAGISPYDCLHAAIMRRYGIKEVLSADKDFEKLPWLKRLDPRLTV